MSSPKITLEQWRALMSVVDAGGYAQAAEALHKSQSALTYAVQKIESLLGVKAFEVQGRKAVLTPTGQLLYRRAKALLDEAAGLERAAAALSAGWEAELRLAVEIIFPNRVLLPALAAFGEASPHTRIELIESVIGGTSEALLSGKVDLAIAPVIPQGFLGEPLMTLRFLPFAHPDHPLHQLKRPLTPNDLRSHRHLVVRDSGVARDPSQQSLDAKQRWVVSHMSTSIQAAAMGYGFSWFPEDKIVDELATGRLKALPIRDGAERRLTLYLIFADRDYAGPGLLKLAEILRKTVNRACTEHKAAGHTSATPKPHKEENPMSIEGGCYCGAVRYRAEGEAQLRAQCHCRECQYISGGSPNVVMGVPEAGFSYTKGTPKVFRRTDLPQPVTREFCADCGTPLTSRAPAIAGVVLVKVGSLDQPAVFGKPDFVVFTIDKQAFHSLPEGVPAFERMPG